MTKDKKKWRSIREFLYILPLILIVFTFSYYPLYGWVYGFFDYQPPQPLSADRFVGFKWFVWFFKKGPSGGYPNLGTLLGVLRNTFAISGISLLFSWFPMIFAVFLNEIKCVPFKKFVQTVTTIPNFISWVLVFAIAWAIFGSDGALSNILINNNIIKEPIDFLTNTDSFAVKHVYFTQWLWLTWKNAGWAAIMYIAAITGIDEQMIEAARVDGASRMQIIRHITIPSILPTYFVIVMMNIASFLTNGMEQFYVFSNYANKQYIEVLDLYVYNLANGGAGYPLSVVVSMFKSVVSIILLTLTNTFSKAIRGEGFI